MSDWPTEATWALHHPHFRREPHPTNVVYVAADRLLLPGLEYSILGAGLFPGWTPKLQLTAPQCRRPSLWNLPPWFLPENRASSLSYHADLRRWHNRTGHVELSSAARGQEFVLDCADYPEAAGWLADMICNQDVPEGPTWRFSLRGMTLPGVAPRC